VSRLAAVALLTLVAAGALVAPAGSGTQRVRPSGIASADARLRDGQTRTLLTVHGLGRFTASCAPGRVGVSFTADHLLPTSDLVVERTHGAPLATGVGPDRSLTPEPPAAVLSQHWQFAPFAAAQVQVATASVAGRAIGTRECSASALVTTGPDQGATITALKGSDPLSRPHSRGLTRSAGLTWMLPSGWRAVDQRLTALSEPVHRLAAATFDLRQTRPDRDCSPDTARRQMPADGALVYLLESRETAARPSALAKLPPRPRQFRLPAPRNHECLGFGSTVTWAEQGRALTAEVLLGPEASDRRVRQVERLLDSLTVDPIAPPEPPLGWRSAISGAYDSIRVPPGWSAHALKRTHTVKRPRLLFRVSNGTVTLRVDELQRGPASPAFPPAGQPLSFDAHRRAGMSFRDYRFSLRIVGAGAADLALAEISARSLGLSGVGRG
jgi:hypothetical protein